MKILLLGEYNSSHYTLKEGLQALGHDVTVVGNGDGFKARKVDIKLNLRYVDGLTFYIKRLLYKLFKIDLTSLSIKRQFNSKKKQFQGYDIVQLINESPFNANSKVEKELLNFIFNNNKNVFLMSCGTDYSSVKYAADGNFRYSILDPYNENRGTKKEIWHALMYLTPDYVTLHNYIFDKIKGVIASDLDYHIPLKNHPKYLGLMPNPINIDALKYIDLPIDDRVVIFHGINRKNYYKKGNDIFEKALHIIQEKFANKIEIITAESLPYDDYITRFDNAHILLDQVFAYDQGFNALEAMAKGKVVFTGAEKEWLHLHNLKEDTVAINALPDANKIAKKLEWLILNPTKIAEISKNAREFVVTKHNYINSAKKYLNTWQKAF